MERFLLESKLPVKKPTTTKKLVKKENSELEINYEWVFFSYLLPLFLPVCLGFLLRFFVSLFSFTSLSSALVFCFSDSTVPGLGFISSLFVFLKNRDNHQNDKSSTDTEP